MKILFYEKYSNLILNWYLIPVKYGNNELFMFINVTNIPVFQVCQAGAIQNTKGYTVHESS